MDRCGFVTRKKQRQRQRKHKQRLLQEQSGLRQGKRRRLTKLRTAASQRFEKVGILAVLTARHVCVCVGGRQEPRIKELESSGVDRFQILQASIITATLRTISSSRKSRSRRRQKSFCEKRASKSWIKLAFHLPSLSLTLHF